MKKLSLLAISVAIAAGAISSSASAAIRQGDFVLSPFGTFTWYAKNRHLKNMGGFGASAGYATNKNFVVNMLVSTNRSKETINAKRNTRVMDYEINGNYYFNPMMKYLQPYLGGGVGLWTFQNVTSNAPKVQTNLHLNAGLAVFVTQNIGLQGGFEYAHTVTASGRNDFIAHLGVIFAFGGHDQDPGNKNMVNHKAK